MLNTPSGPFIPPENRSSVGVSALKSLTVKSGYLLNGQGEKVDMFLRGILNSEGRDWLRSKEVIEILEELFKMVRVQIIRSISEKDVSGHEIDIDELKTNADQFIDNICEGVRRLDEKMELNVETIRARVKQELAGLGQEEEREEDNVIQLREEKVAVA